MAELIRVAVGILVDNCKGDVRVLITKRPIGGVLGGYWEFPGGKLEEGESYEDCVVREYEEEVGVKVRVRGELEMVEHEYDYGRVRLQPFYCEYVSGVLQNLAVVEHKWVKPGELRMYEMPAANVGMIQRVVKELGGEAEKMRAMAG